MSLPNPQTNNLNSNEAEAFQPLSNPVIAQLRTITLKESKLRVMDILSTMLNNFDVTKYPTENNRGYLRAIEDMQHSLRSEWR